MHERTIIRYGLTALLMAFGCESAVDVTADATSGTDAAPGSTGMEGTTTSVPSTTGGASGGPTTASSSADSSTTSSATTGSRADSGESTGDCGFLGCGNPQPRGFECSVWEQECPPGEKCAPVNTDGGSTWNGTKCVPVARSPGATGEACTVTGTGVDGLDSCEAGSICWYYDSTLEGTCVAQCVGSENAPTCEARDAFCRVTSEGALTLCVPTCDPLDQTGCPEETGCHFGDPQFECFPPTPTQAAGLLEGCESLSACTPGLGCINAADVGGCEPGAGRCCTPWCDLNGSDCPGTMECTPFFTEGERPLGAQDIGICTSA